MLGAEMSTWWHGKVRTIKLSCRVPDLISIWRCDTKCGVDTGAAAYHYIHMSSIEPKDLTAYKKFFEEPSTPKQRQYEALRAYYVEGLPGNDVAKKFR
jgi:hypothetical protein